MPDTRSRSQSSVILPVPDTRSQSIVVLPTPGTRPPSVTAPSVSVTTRSRSAVRLPTDSGRSLSHKISVNYASCVYDCRGEISLLSCFKSLRHITDMRSQSVTVPHLSVTMDMTSQPITLPASMIIMFSSLLVTN